MNNITETFIQAPSYKDYAYYKDDISLDSLVFIEDEEKLIALGKEYLFVTSDMLLSLRFIYEYVDMGEAGTWTKYPIGVSEWDSETYDKIKYFLWGDIDGYIKSLVGIDKQFSGQYTDYKFSGKGSSTASPKFTKYCIESRYGKDGFTDNLTTLELKDDAAHVVGGGSWRMPTSEEFQKLKDLCDNEWVTDYNGVPGLNGRLFKLKTDESKQLFFPAAGYGNTGSVGNVGSSGSFWSSSLNNSDSHYGLCLIFSSGTIDSKNGYGRFYGCPIIGFMPESPEKYLTKKEASETYATKKEIENLSELITLVESNLDWYEGE